MTFYAPYKTVHNMMCEVCEQTCDELYEFETYTQGPYGLCTHHTRICDECSNNLAEVFNDLFKEYF